MIVRNDEAGFRKVNMSRVMWMALGLAATGLMAAEADPKATEGAAKPNSTAQVKTTTANPEIFLLDRPRTNHFEFSPGPDDWKIAKLVAAVLRQSHYSQIPFDDALSEKFLERYLDALDPAHIFFLRSDLEEFSKWRNTLDDLTLRLGDTTPANVIFGRFLERFEAHNQYITNLLATETFEFKGQDRYLVNRKDQPRPANEAEARKLWRERLRYEYLTEKLNLGRPEEVAAAVRERLQKKSPKEILESIRISREKKEALAREREAARTTNETATADSEVKVYNEISSALKGKLGDERIEQIVKLVEERIEKAKPEEIAAEIARRVEKDNAEEIVKIISRRYARQWRMLREFESDDVLQIYLNSLAHVFDPHSDYMGRPSLDNFNIGMKLSLFGIGALLRSEDGYVKIQELMPGPAMKSKRIKPNDKIVAVAQGTNEPVDVVDMKLSKVVELIRGPKGSEVRLTIIPADAPDPSMRKVVTLIRDEIKLEDQEAKAKIIEFPATEGKPLRLGIIDLPSFYADLENRRAGRKSTTTDVGRLLEKLKKEQVQGVILDLRRNGGGSLEEAINLTGLFIKEGPVVQVRDPDGRVTVDADGDPAVVYEGPLVVLTSRFSASASEILAGALQDYGRAVVVGESSTHGKGTVQSLLQLAPLMRPQTTNNLGALKYTIRKFYRVSGSSTQLRGVVPDIILPAINNHADIGEAALPNALPWDTIDKADFDPVNVVSPVLGELRKRSEARVAQDKDFQTIREDIERYKKAKEDKTVSMNEEERFREKRENEARAEARKKELRNRPEPSYKIYDITLKIVDEPGLPAPTVATNKIADLTVRAPSAALDEDEAAELEDKNDTTPALDPVMDEGKRVLTDLIELTAKSRNLATAVK